MGIKMIEFEYRGFWIESQPFDQAENGHPEDGITYTSYVWLTKEECDNLEDYIFELCVSYNSSEELKEGIVKLIDRYIQKNKLKRKKD